MRKLKKITSLLLIVLLVLGNINLASADENTRAFELGDVDNNGTIDASDALLALKHAAKLITVDEAYADIDHNGVVDATDALYILKFAAKLIPDFSDDSLHPKNPVVDNLENIKSFIKQYGATDSDGTKYIGDYMYDEEEDFETFVLIELINGQLVFSFGSSSLGGDVITLIEMIYKGDPTQLEFYCMMDEEYLFEARTKIDPKKVTIDASYIFDVIANDFPYEEGLEAALKDLGVSSTTLAFLLWDQLLAETSGYRLTDIGFVNFTY